MFVLIERASDQSGSGATHIPACVHLQTNFKYSMDRQRFFEFQQLCKFEMIFILIHSRLRRNLIKTQSLWMDLSKVSILRRSRTHDILANGVQKAS